MKKKIYGLLFLILFSVMSSSERVEPIDLNLTYLNKTIYDYFYYKAEHDSLAFKAESAWLINYDSNRTLLLNSEEVEKFSIIRNSPKTNHYAQIGNDFSHLLEENNILLVNLDRKFHNLDNLSAKDRIDLLIYFTQQQYITYIKGHNRELVDMPSFLYPITDVNNLILSSIEYKILLNAYLTNDEDEVIELLKKFYAIRLNRWRSLTPFIQTYERSIEKTLGLSYYKAIELLRHLENSSNTLLDKGDTADIVQNKLYSILDNDLVLINSMNKDKAENKGYLIASLYEKLGWDYQPETTRDNFHVFLGNQLSMRTTEIDSVYTAIRQSKDFADITKKANIAVEEYNSDVESLTLFENLSSPTTISAVHIYFDHYTKDFSKPDETFFLNSQQRQLILPNVTDYKIKSNWLEIEVNNQGFIYNMDRRDKNFQTFFDSNLVLSVDYKAYSFERLLETNNENPLQFANLYYRSPNLTYKINLPGELIFNNNLLTIKLEPKLQYQIEEEYWKLIDDLNKLLIARGVPENWLATYVNHPEFRIYHSIVRHFTSLPEHQVSRGDRDQNWYMTHFGVNEKVRKGAEFRRQNRAALQAAERRHGIHYELLMSIMAIETDYANPRWRGNFYTFPTLVSQYVLLPRRQRFAVNELVALYQFSEKTNNDVYHFIGSFAGAAGWGQFIPTSLNAYFIDANDNFYDVDIFAIDDVLHSISNYLNQHGLSGRNMGNYQARFRAVRAYNHSDAYVRAVLYIYDELRKQR